MAMTNSEKQASYRKRRIKEGEGERLQAVISLHAKRGLERLAQHNGLSQVAMLERLILEEQHRVTAVLEGDAYRIYVGEMVTV